VAGNDGAVLGLVVKLSEIDRDGGGLTGKTLRRTGGLLNRAELVTEIFLWPEVVVEMGEILAGVNLVPIGLEGPAVGRIAVHCAEVACADDSRKGGGGGETEGESK
jgi:hypothetical protein